MRKSLLIIILTVSCGNMYAAARLEKQRIDKRIMPLTIHNTTSKDMEFVYARTDPMNSVLPTNRVIIPAWQRVEVNVSCLFGLLLIPKLFGMLNIELLQELKDRYFALKPRDARVYVRIDPTYDAGKFKVAPYLNLRDEFYPVNIYEADVIPLATDDQVRDTIIDRCKAYLPASEGLYMLGKRKFLRRSAG